MFQKKLTSQKQHSYQTVKNLSLATLILGICAYVILIIAWFTALITLMQLNLRNATFEDLPK